MNILLFDDHSVDHLLPLSFTRPAAEMRVGILTIAEKWKNWLGVDISHLTRTYLSVKFRSHYESDNIYLNGRSLPNSELVSKIKQLGSGHALINAEGELIAFRTQDHLSLEELNSLDQGNTEIFEGTEVKRPYDLFRLNADELNSDYQLLTAGRASAKISSSNTIIGGENIFLEEGATVEGSILNDKAGPIYIGKNAEIMEGSKVRGGLALCEGAALKMGAKIYGAVTVGPHSKVGGEVNNSVILGYSNKGHDGFLGNSVLGEWCNIGADSNNSNLKNNYDQVRLWDYVDKRFAKTGLQFCGLIMGDHSKCGINTMFNTGTVVGVSSNLFGSGFPRNYVPSFAWGGNAGFTTYQLNKAFQTAEIVMKRRGIDLDETERDILTHIFNQTTENRFWEKQNPIKKA